MILIRYDKCVDYGALGILTYELLTDETPFNDEELFGAILNNSIHFKSTIFTKNSQKFCSKLINT